MGAIKDLDKVVFFAGILYKNRDLLDEAIKKLESRLGNVSRQSPVFEFIFSDYYEDEMGRGLKKQFLAFQQGSPESLAEVKTYTNELEKSYSTTERDGLRRINIDPGYVDRAKVVLASTKDRGQRIYIGNGIYGEVTLIFKGKGCEPLPWTYPDYKTSLAVSFFLSIRDLLK